jgi:hypothetical protein
MYDEAGYDFHQGQIHILRHSALADEADALLAADFDLVIVESSAANRPVSWFGFVQLPDFIAPDAGIKEIFEEIHESLVNLLLVFVGLHVAAALKHQFIDRDGLLFRMLPGRRS